MDQAAPTKPLSSARLTLRDAITAGYLYARDHGEELLRIAAADPVALKHANKLLAKSRDFRPLDPAEHRGLRWLIRWLTAQDRRVVAVSRRSGDGAGVAPCSAVRAHLGMLDEIEAAARSWLIEYGVIRAIAEAAGPMTPPAPVAS